MEKYSQTEFENFMKGLDSDNSQIRLESAESLCWFIENHSDNLNFNYLNQNIQEIINILNRETVSDVGYKLGETIFEFIWLEKLDKINEKEIITKLVNLKTTWIYPSYLDNEDFINIPGVKEYIIKYKTCW